MGSFILGALGFIAGLWAEKFDHMATVTNFIITPLSFLSGVFYSIDRLPDFFQSISQINPFFYMIDGFRYAFIGKSDASILTGSLTLIFINVILIYLCYLMFRSGYKLKS